MSTRHAVFISHATPEDNSLARWLSLQLAARGYTTWCDVVKLLGGDDWWKDTETSIRDHSCKFLHLASAKSVTKPGVLRELDLALSVASPPKRFIVPLRVDAVPWSAFPRDIGTKLNAIDFSKGWAPGLAKLLELLTEDAVPVQRDGNASVVTDFWRKSYPAQEGVTRVQQPYSSNWFAFDQMPERINLHHIGWVNRKLDTREFEYPTERNGEFLLSFASAARVANDAALGRTRIGFTRAIPIDDFLGGRTQCATIRAGEARNHLVVMLRDAWERYVASIGWKRYELAGGHPCFWLPLGALKGDEVAFTGVDGKIHRRGLVGFKNYKNPDGTIRKVRYWHFAVQGRPLLRPVEGFSMRTHVVFSEDGKTPIESAARQHSARRSQCRNWWNDDWRDRLLAAVAQIGGSKGRIPLRLGEDCEVAISTRPLIFDSPVAYAPTARIVEDLPDDPDDAEADE